MAVARVQGLVLDVQRRAGVSAAGKPYDFTTARVLVADRDVTEVTFRGDMGTGLARAAEVDVLVELDTYGGRLQVTALDVWPSDHVPSLTA